MMKYLRKLSKIFGTFIICFMCVILNSETAKASAQTVDIIIFAGQSNMSGNGGNAAMAPAVPIYAGYQYLPNSAPGVLSAISEPFGQLETGYISDAAQYQNGSLVSAFVNSYYSATGVPVVAVPATRGGTDSTFWANSVTKADLLSRFVKTRKYLESNGYTVRNKYLVFLQGESDAVKGTDVLEYKNNLIAAFQPLFANGLNQVFLITPGRAVDGIYSYDKIVGAQIALCNESDLFTLASSLLYSLQPEYLSDAVHYNQAALNMVGAAAGSKVARGAGY